VVDTASSLTLDQQTTSALSDFCNNMIKKEFA
jgi:hypothetical protein